MSADELVIVCLVVLLISTVFSVVGLGVGLLYVPILLAGGAAFNTAAAASLFIVISTGLAACILPCRL